MNRRNNIVYTALLLGAVVLGNGACSYSSKETSHTTVDVAFQADLDPEGFQAELADTPDAVLLDVRTPEEIAQGTIAGAIPMNFKDADFESRLSALDKTKPYFVYCAAGGRSSKVVDLMKEQGFKQIYNLEGGFEAWKAKGLEQSKPQ